MVWGIDIKNQTFISNTKHTFISNINALVDIK